MRLLTFLGVGRYSPTTYVWQGREHTGKYAPAASCHFLHPDSLTVFLTEEAQQQVFPEFRDALPEGLKPDPIPIPLGRDEHELWQIFGQVSGAVHAGEEVAFDITHGLRSFPLLGLLVAAFLRSGMGVSVRAVLYGAYDIREQERTPMFDLTPMLSLLEWAVAADRFNRTGDARYLASLLESERKSLAEAAGGDPAQLEQVGRLGNLAGALTDISRSLRLIRPQRAMEKIAALPHYIEEAQPALERAAAAHPFSMLLESVTNAYLPLALEDPLATERVGLVLERQKAMVNWYLEREQWVQAITLAREWLVSWVMVQLGQPHIVNQSARESVEHVLGAETDAMRRAKDGGRPFTSVFLKSVAEVETVLSLWSALAQVRNDIDHAGMRETAGKPEDLLKQIRNCIAKLNELPRLEA